MSQGTVKAVLSGDTLLLLGRGGAHGPPPEMQLSLASLQAPKLGRAPGIPDEQFAWDSREFLRKKCIGKQVTFKVEFQAGASGRSFGWVKLDGESLAAAVASQGWARVKDQGTSSKSSELDELVELGKAAETGKLGVYTDDSAKQASGEREVKWTDVDGVAVLAAHKGVPVKATIEHMRDGSSYRALLHDSWTMISFSLAGVACPRMNAPARRPPPAANAAAAVASATAAKTAGMSAASIVAGGLPVARAANGSANGSGGAAGSPPPPPQPEPHAAEAKYFSEIRLLHREVELLLQGVDKQGNLFGAVLHPKGDVRHELLKQGLARMVDWSLVYVTRADALAMRQAENEGKRAKLRLWREWSPPQIDGEADYPGVVVEVHSGDQISVSVPGGPVGQERRLALSSIRAPRVGNPRRGVEDEPWAVEAREALRKMVIGRSVKVVVDYQRDIPKGNGETSEKRAFATVTVAGGAAGAGGKCLQEVLVETGMAGVARLRQDDPRTEHYDAIVAAEAVAKAAKKGMHSGVSPPAHRLTDLCGDSKKAKTYVNFLVRQGTVKAIVEHVFGGSRFKVFVPKENCAFMFAMTEVRCPQPPRAGDNTRGGARPGDPFGREALAFSREKLMQRNVELRVVDMDKNGVALGFLYLGTGKDKRNFAIDIVKSGFGKLDVHALERAEGGGEAMLKAQAAAKASKAGLWSVEPTEDEMKKKEFVVPDDMSKYRLSEIANGGHFFVHDPEGGDLARIEAKLKELKDKVGTSGATMEPRKGTQCAALFDDGNGPAWYRARVMERTPVGLRVRYVDHGNSAIVKASGLRPLDPSYFTFPAQARECVMAFMRVPSLDEEFGRDAAMMLNTLGWGKDLLGRALGRDAEGRLMMSLYESEDSESLNETIVANGVARVASNADKLATSEPAKDMVARLREAQEVAHKGRANMWRYGDCQSDDEGDF